jgi:hypothetical protein
MSGGNINMPAGKGYTITVGGKTFKIKLPKFLVPDVEREPEMAVTPNAPSREFKNVSEATQLNELDALDEQMHNIGRTKMEQKVFD